MTANGNLSHAGSKTPANPGLLGKPLRRQIVGIASGRRLADLDQTFFDAAFEIGIDKTESDAEFSSQEPLRLRAVLFDSIQQAQQDPGILRAFFARSGHGKGPADQPYYSVQLMNVKPRSMHEHNLSR